MRLLFLLATLWPISAHAEIAFSEILWMGSDSSSADEWIELFNTSEEDIDVTGWSIRYQNSSGNDTLMLTIPEGTIAPHEYFLISNYDAAHSVLAIDPDLVTTSVSLPNTNLHLSLLDADGNLVDEADDGSGAPLAGANTSSLKASMERVDFLASGRAQESWSTATERSNIDPESMVIASPGAERSAGSSSSSSSCSDDLQIAIDIQSGEVTGVGSTTLNVQAVAVAGSLSGLGCNFDFDDGFTSNSCNPGSHAFNAVGTYLLTLRVTNRCGQELLDSLLVTVEDDGTSPGTSQPTFDNASIILFSALPNPEGADTDSEVLILKNMIDRGSTLDGWKIEIETTKKRTYKLSGSIGALGTLQIYSSESTFSLPNGEATLRLLDPLGGVRSTLHWEKAEEGREYFPEDIRDMDVTGTVQAVLSATRFVIEASPRVREKVGIEQIPVELLGVHEILNPEYQSSYSLSASMWLRALVEKKRVTLELGDDDLWTADQFLRATVFTDGNYSVIEDGILKGYLEIDEDNADEKLRALQQTAKKEKRGLWAYSSEKKATSSVSSSSGSTLPKIISDPSLYDELLISEIYPSPFPASQISTDMDTLLGDEWIELHNPGEHILDISGWTLTVGTKKILLPASLSIAPGSYVLLHAHALKFSLKNTGNLIVLSSPDGSVLREVSYPSTKNGFSFSVDQERGEYCMSTTPTPREKNFCTEPTPVDRSAAAKKAATTRKENTLAGYVSLYQADAAHAQERDFSEGVHQIPWYSTLLLLVLSSTFGLVGGLGGAFVLRRK